MDRPLVSAIVPVFNGERFLAETLSSIFAQDYTPLEVIVVDDGSTDRSVEIARGFPLTRLIQQANQGAGAARNTGIAAARGAYVAFLDVNDLWTPDKLTAQIGYHLEHPEVGYSCTLRDLISVPGSPPGRLAYGLPPVVAATYASALVIRRDALETVGVFTTKPVRELAEDADWFARAADAVGPMTILPRVLLQTRLYDKHGPSYVDTTRSGVLRALKASIDRKRKARPRLHEGGPWA